MLISPAEVVTGALVNAIAVVGRQISKAAAGLRKPDEVLATARWFETFRLTGTVPDLPDLSPASAERLAAVLNGAEVQATLQELLAARLTDAPEIDASRARDAVRVALSSANPDIAGALAGYYDDQIGSLVARLEAEEPPVLPQIRSEAFSSRMISVLHAIERHTAVLADEERGRGNGRLAARARAGPAAGRPLAEVTDPFDLEVHRPVQADDPPPGLPLLPAYVPRQHDHRLAEVARAAAEEGRSGLAVLVGGSSTGKTRACWEALRVLRDRPERWRVWHPIDPTRPEAALRELPAIGPYTVIWLNEAQFYLDASGGLGERVAAGLRELLRDPARAPVLVLATLWPEFWDRLTARPGAGTVDLHAEVRELLAGRDITVPAAFTAGQLGQACVIGDPRLAQAAQGAEGGRVVQFLAGAPQLIARYRNAPPAASALISVAIDARRLGMGVELPLAFVEAAAPGYLTDAEWDGLGEDWLEQALAYTAAPCNGIRGPLARIRSRPGAGPNNGTACRLADYLEQHGRHARADVLPSKSFWEAVIAHADLPDLPGLADQAEKRGLYRYAALLDKRSIAASDLRRAPALLGRLRLVDPGNAPEAAAWIAAQVTSARVKDLEELLRSFGAQDRAGIQVIASLILSRYRADPQRIEATTRLLGLLLVSLHAVDDNDTIADLAGQAVARAEFMQLGSQLSLAWFLRQAGADDASSALAIAAAGQTNPADAKLVGDVLAQLSNLHADNAIAVLARRAAEHADLRDPEFAGRLLRTLRRLGDSDAIAVLLGRDPAGQADPASYRIGSLLETLQELGAYASVTALADRILQYADPAYPERIASAIGALRPTTPQAAAALATDVANLTDVTDPVAVVSALRALRNAGAHDASATLLARNPAECGALTDAAGVASLLDELRQSGDHDAIAVLLARNPAVCVDPADSRGVAALLDQFLAAGADDQAAMLLARDPAAHANPADLESVGHLLHSLRRAGADMAADALTAQAAKHVDPADTATISHHLTMDTHLSVAADVFIASRPALHVDLTNTRAVAFLLERLLDVQARDEVAALLARNPAQDADLADLDAVSELLEAFNEVFSVTFS